MEPSSRPGLEIWVSSSRIISAMYRRSSFHPAKLASLFMLGLFLALGAAAQNEWPAPHPSVISKFQEEEAQHSHIMNALEYLTDVYGPRLTNSPNIREAGGYAVNTLNSWGLENAHEEPWGPFGRGWSNELFEANEISPRDFPLIAYPKAWTPGTAGPITAQAVFAQIEKEGDFDRFRGDLKGKFVL